MLIRVRRVTVWMVCSSSVGQGGLSGHDGYSRVENPSFPE